MKFLVDNALSPQVASLLALSSEHTPSLVLFRRRTGRRPQQQSRLLLANLDQIAVSLARGAIVVFDENKLRIRQLPIG